MKILSILTVAFLSILNGPRAQQAGEIIFSPLPLNPVQPAGLTNEFTAGDNLYAVAFLPKTVLEMYSNTLPDPKLEVEVFIYEIKPPLYSYQGPQETQLTFASMWVSGKILHNKYHLFQEVLHQLI